MKHYAKNTVGESGSTFLKNKLQHVRITHVPTFLNKNNALI